MANFFSRLLDTKDASSSKRFVTLIIAAHFILASFVILIIFTLLVFRTTKGNLEFLKPIIDVFKTILEYDFKIILGGLGFIGVADLGQAMVQRELAKSTNVASTITQTVEGPIADSKTKVDNPDGK